MKVKYDRPNLEQYYQEIDKDVDKGPDMGDIAIVQPTDLVTPKLEGGQVVAEGAQGDGQTGVDGQAGEQGVQPGEIP